MSETSVFAYGRATKEGLLATLRIAKAAKNYSLELYAEAQLKAKQGYQVAKEHKQEFVKGYNSIS